ncbi:MAG: diphosphomevalonate decarboxylase [Bacteroidota bacterium]
MSMITAGWQSPSNIALVKYWGKKGEQLPENPSISFSLNQATTTTTITAEHRPDQKDISLDFFFENLPNEAFSVKIRSYIARVCKDYNWLNNHHLVIRSSNTFPHSSGIASSASAFSALALCLVDLNQQITSSEEDFLRQASIYARLGSGSACRSVYGGYNVWGSTSLLIDSSDEYAINIDHRIHPSFQNLNDTILIVEKGSKQVSSTKGHALLKEHPFASTRYSVANSNTEKLLDILQKGDIKGLMEVVEGEALMLHALMMSSPTPFILMKPNSLAIIEKIIDFRNQTDLHLFFTLDAGANVHLLSTAEHNAQVQDFVQNELVGYCQNGLYFCNAIGKGPIKTTHA